jgi:hypothetical protein
MSIQRGDTVEVQIETGCREHPIEHRLLKKGDRIVVVDVDDNYVWYFTEWMRRHQIIRKTSVKKVNANHVEIKFR